MSLPSSRAPVQEGADARDRDRTLSEVRDDQGDVPGLVNHRVRSIDGRLVNTRTRVRVYIRHHRRLESVTLAPKAAVRPTSKVNCAVQAAGVQIVVVDHRSNPIGSAPLRKQERPGLARRRAGRVGPPVEFPDQRAPMRRRDHYRLGAVTQHSSLRCIRSSSGHARARRGSRISGEPESTKASCSAPSSRRALPERPDRAAGRRPTRSSSD